VGNRLTDWFGGTYTYNNSNELTAYPAYSWTYDNNGNTTSETVGSSVTSFNWDFENRMTSVVLPGTGGTVSFKYDPFGRRIYKSSTSGTTIYAYDGDNRIEDLSSAGTATARYTQGLGIDALRPRVRDFGRRDEPLEVYEGGKSYYYHADGLGSIVALTKSTGTAANTYFGYNTFGGMPNPSETVANPFRFTAREWDSETSLYNYRARNWRSVTSAFRSWAMMTQP
jgi:YD repeat-containing protein